jgi:hypothetical protein
MMRHSAHWVTNVKRGGKPVAAVADGIMRDLAIAAAAAVGVNFAGVDILYDRDERPTVLEVNSMPAWSGLQRTTPTISPKHSRATLSPGSHCGPRAVSESAPAPEWSNPIARAFEEACRDELDAPKPGNVHVFADGHRMTVTDFRAQCGGCDATTCS